MLVLLLAFLAAIPLPAKPARYVTDNASVLDDARAAALNEKLAGFERGTSDQLLVYVDRDLPAGTTIEEMGSQAIHQWGVGQKGKDNGVILFLFTGPHKMRIEVGYGLEATLTDAEARRITSTVMKPLLQQNDTAGAIEAGANAIMAAIRSAQFRGTGRTVAETERAAAPSGNDDEYGGLVVFVVIAVLIGLAILAVIISSRPGRTTDDVPSSWTPSPRVRSWSSAAASSTESSSFSSSGSDSSSSGSDSSSSSSDFSGGGGDSGGGGASDSW